MSTGAARIRRLEASLGHVLFQQQHNTDLWIAATAIPIGIRLVSDDGIFEGAPGPIVETV